MNYKKLQISAFFLVGVGLAVIHAQTMYVIQINGTETNYPLSSVRKMTFSGGNVTVQKTDNSTGQFDLSEVRYLNFTLLSSLGSMHKQEKNVHLHTYPNPVVDVLNIDLSGEEDAGTLSILALDGRVIQTQLISSNSIVTLQLGHLPKGVYLCQLLTSGSIKTVKIIKQ